MAHAKKETPKKEKRLKSLPGKETPISRKRGGEPALEGDHGPGCEQEKKKNRPS